MQKPTISVGTELPGCVVVAIENDHILIRRESGEIAKCDFQMAERLLEFTE